MLVFGSKYLSTLPALQVSALVIDHPATHITRLDLDHELQVASLETPLSQTRSGYTALNTSFQPTTAQDSQAIQWMKNTTCVDSASRSLRSLTPRLPDHSRSSFWYVRTSSTSAMQTDSSLQCFSRINLPPPTCTHALRVLAWICLSPKRTSFVCLPWRDA